MTLLDDDLRICLYSWLTNVLTTELTDVQLRAFQDDTFMPLWHALDDMDLGALSTQIQQALRQLQDIPNAQLELSADFAQLFLLDGDISALPYASIYLSKAQHQDHFMQLEELLYKNQLALSSDMKEASDHIAVYLQLLLETIKKQEHEMQRKVLDLLLVWVPAWVSKSKKSSQQYAFYPSVLMLLEKLIDKEQNVLYSES